jgi:hypothetical protein
LRASSTDDGTPADDDDEAEAELMAELELLRAETP